MTTRFPLEALWPLGPTGPVGPAGPGVPVALLEPGVPVAPVGPAGPVAPVGPAGPVAPVLPSWLVPACVLAVPSSGTLAGPVGSLLAICSTAARSPCACGAKETVMSQLSLGS